ncbi:hypothetical protein MTO96_013960 [Rhipicephalus appendiculatus]
MSKARASAAVSLNRLARPNEAHLYRGRGQRSGVRYVSRYGTTQRAPSATTIELARFPRSASRRDDLFGSPRMSRAEFKRSRQRAYTHLNVQNVVAVTGTDRPSAEGGLDKDAEHTTATSPAKVNEWRGSGGEMESVAASPSSVRRSLQISLTVALHSSTGISGLFSAERG